MDGEKFFALLGERTRDRHADENDYENEFVLHQKKIYLGIVQSIGLR
jgi:hypothetical protein